MIQRPDRKQARIRRHERLRKKVKGTAERPRLSVFRSLHHIYAQIIDDTAGRTLIAASTLEPEVKAALSGAGSNIENAKVVGKYIAERAKAKGIVKVVFDRGGQIYHGKIAAVADSARENGLEF